MKTNVTVVIPNYNGKKLLEKNLPFLIKAKENVVNRISKIIVVDDGSRDDSLEFLETNFNSEITILKHRQNRGFAATVNFGVRKAKTGLICLLNTDVIPEVNFLEKVIPHFKDEEVFGVTLHEIGFGPAIGWFSDGYLQHKSGNESSEVQNTLWINGGSGVFRKSYWRQMKGLDEAIYYPFYWEDVDLGYRAHKRGLKLLWEPNAVVEHKHESTINTNNFRKEYLLKIKERNHLLFVWKNITSKTLFKQHLYALFERIITHPGYLIILLMALRKYSIIVKRREREIRESILSDEVVLAKFNN